MLRVRSPDVPIRIPGGVVQIDVRAAIRAIVAIPADKGAAEPKRPKAHTMTLYLYFDVTRTLSGGMTPPVPLCGYAAKGCSQEGEAPTVQYALPAALSRATYAPQDAPG